MLLFYTTFDGTLTNSFLANLIDNWVLFLIEESGCYFYLPFGVGRQISNHLCQILYLYSYFSNWIVLLCFQVIFIYNLSFNISTFKQKVRCFFMKAHGLRLLYNLLYCWWIVGKMMVQSTLTCFGIFHSYYEGVYTNTHILY